MKIKLEKIYDELEKQPNGIYIKIYQDYTYRYKEFTNVINYTNFHIQYEEITHLSVTKSMSNVYLCIGDETIVYERFFETEEDRNFIYDGLVETIPLMGEEVNIIQELNLL